MSAARPSIICERVRAQISVELDGELSQLERAMLAAHLGRCADCSAYDEEVAAFTGVLRESPLERMHSHVTVRRPRRLAVPRVPSVAAAALALAVVGVASQLAAHRTPETAGFEPPTRFQTLGELERELTLLEIASGGIGPHAGHETFK